MNLTLTENKKEEQSKLGSVANHFEGESSPFMCPITSLPMNGRHRFSFLASCGCVFSEKALKEVPSPTCLSCGKEYTEDDVIPIYGEEIEVQKLREKLDKAEQERALKDGEKPEKASRDAPLFSSSSSADFSSFLFPL